MIRKIVKYEGKVQASEISYEVAATSETKVVYEDGRPVPVDKKGVPLEDTHVTRQFPRTDLVGRLRTEDGDLLEVRRPLAADEEPGKPDAVRAELGKLMAKRYGVEIVDDALEVSSEDDAAKVG